MKRHALLLSCFLLLSACASSPVVHRSCPQVAIVRDLDRVEDYGREAADPSTMVSVASMEKIEGSCSYQEGGVDINFDLFINGQKGPRLGGDRISFPYFVSLIAPDQTVISKEIMTVELIFPDKERNIKIAEPLHVFVPLDEVKDASAYRVLSGFQLTEEQYKAALKAAGK